MKRPQSEQSQQSPAEEFSMDLAALRYVAVQNLPIVANAHAQAAASVHRTRSFDGLVFRRPGGGASAAEGLWTQLRDALQNSMAVTADNLHDSSEAVLRIVEDFKDADLYNENAFKSAAKEFADYGDPAPGPWHEPPKPTDPAERAGSPDSLLDG
ncbi:MAG TPA: hypothetical protein VGF17_09870 [Phytomonospora sp.]